ncbi:MAG: type II toxin-antitoxin system antitoxin SocA domain-containing protein [Candidatus Berkelbacteria bacterium]
MEKAKYSAELIADYLIYKASKDGKKLSNKKLQKLLYYSQAWNLVFNGGPLFYQDIEAWVHGPAVREIYLKYKKFGYGYIDQNVSDDIQNKIKENDLLDEVMRFYGKFDAEYLEELTHNELPWQKAREGLDIDSLSDNVISIDLMKEYYGQKLAEAK